MTTAEATGNRSRDARMPEAVIDDAMVEQMTAKIGIDLRIEHSVNNEEATRIAVAKFAGGIGDVNTLWTDEEAGSRSDYGSPVAPPSFGAFSERRAPDFRRGTDGK